MVKINMIKVSDGENKHYVINNYSQFGQHYEYDDFASPICRVKDSSFEF
jgi:hypothetical protein